MIVAGSMFIGIGVGYLIGNVGAGTLIGLGVGFILEEILKRKRRKDVSH